MIEKSDILVRLNFRAFYSGQLNKFKASQNGQAMGLCPFHDDSNPSFSVNLENGRFNCFSCEAKGDVFSFYMQRHNVDFIEGDFCDIGICEKIMLYFNNKVDVVLSDMAANTSGNKTLDSYRTGELCLNAMNLSRRILSQDGVFLSKIFMGSIYNEINEKAKKSFKKVIKYKPLSSKKESKEIYIFCKGNLKI